MNPSKKKEYKSAACSSKDVVPRNFPSAVYLYTKW